jgi:cell division protein FtsX
MADLNTDREIAYLNRNAERVEKKLDDTIDNYRKNFFENDDSVVNRLKALEGTAMFVRWCFGIIGALIVVAIATNILKIAVPEFRLETQQEHPIGKSPP